MNLTERNKNSYLLGKRLREAGNTFIIPKDMPKVTSFYVMAGFKNIPVTNFTRGHLKAQPLELVVQEDVKHSEVVNSPSEYTIINNQNRGVLSEGRNYQMAFAFCKKKDEKTFETIQPISPCKDYLNDVVFSEATGENISAYGLKTKRNHIFDEDYGYMVISIEPNMNGGDYGKLQKDRDNLNENYKLLEEFMQEFDKLFMDTNLTRIEKANDNYFIVYVPRIWVEQTYTISLYSLLLRIGQFWKKAQHPFEYIKNFKDFQPDVYLLNSCKTKIETIIKNKKLPTFDLITHLGGNRGTYVHNYGICAVPLNIF